MSRLFWITFGLIVLGGAGWKLANSIAASTLPALIFSDPNEIAQNKIDLSANQQNRNDISELSATENISPELKRASTETARQLSRNMTAECQILLRPPYVIAGDFHAKELQRYYNEIILPVEQALLASYFRERPTEPVTILLFSNDTRYQQYAQKLDNRLATGYYGYYNRTKRRILINISTGSGTLVHELTHSFTQKDFPTLPEWLDEGLASLHEESDFNKAGTRLVGFSNWRLPLLKNGIQQKKIQSLRSLMTSQKLRSNKQEIDYAHARYFCLFLQQKNLLVPFYREFRRNQMGDPSGLKTLLKVTGNESLDDIEAEFFTWVTQLKN